MRDHGAVEPFDLTVSGVERALIGDAQLGYEVGIGCLGVFGGDVELEQYALHRGRAEEARPMSECAQTLPRLGAQAFRPEAVVRVCKGFRQ